MNAVKAGRHPLSPRNRLRPVRLGSPGSAKGRPEDRRRDKPEDDGVGLDRAGDTH